MGQYYGPFAGSFVSSLDELLPLLGLQPHQLAAVTNPMRPIREIVDDQPLPTTELGRIVNERLCDPDLR